MALGGVVTGRSGQPTRRGVHPLLEILPPLIGRTDGAFRHGTTVLLECMEQYEQAFRPPVENPKEPTAVVAAELAKLSFDLTAMRKRQWRIGSRKHIETINLIVNDYLSCNRVQVVNELVDRFSSVPRSVVDGLHLGHSEAMLPAVLADAGLSI